MSRIKVMTIVGTRPEIIRLSRVITVLERVTRHRLVHTGQHYDYELSDVFFKELGLSRPQHHLKAAGRSPAQTIGNVIARADAVLEKERPEAVLVLGDTTSCLAVIPAKRRRIPVFHMEAGNRCFDMRTPEELNRRIVDHASDINLCYTEHARRHLLAEGFPADRVLKTGSPMKEVLDYYREAIDASRILESLGLSKGRYFVVSIQREENVDDASRLELLLDALDALAAKYGFPLVFSVHPRTRKRLKKRRHRLVRRVAPMGFFDYVTLQKNALCSLSDSGTLAEESAILGFPAVTLRETHERPEGMDEGAVIMTGLSPQRILQAVEMTLTQFRQIGPCRLPDDYDVDQVSWKVAKIILSYTDYVNRRVFQKIVS